MKYIAILLTCLCFTSLHAQFNTIDENDECSDAGAYGGFGRSCNFTAPSTTP